MKKTLIILLVDGREITRDITKESIHAPIGAKANDEVYAKLCHSVCLGGYTDTEKVTDRNYTHIAPSQIKSVSVKFED